MSPNLIIAADSETAARFPQLVVELIPLCKGHGAVFKENRDKVRDIGQRIFDVASHAGMQVAYYFIQALWTNGHLGEKGEDDFHPRELEMTWDGIGYWLD